MTKDNKILGSFLLEGIPPAPRGQEKFDVTFDINSDGILTVTVTHRRNRGNTGSMKIDARTSGRLTEEEVNAMIEEAEKMKLQDEAEENRVKSLNRVLVGPPPTGNGTLAWARAGETNDWVIGSEATAAAVRDGGW